MKKFQQIACSIILSTATSLPEAPYAAAHYTTGCNLEDFIGRDLFGTSPDGDYEFRVEGFGQAGSLWKQFWALNDDDDTADDYYMGMYRFDDGGMRMYDDGGMRMYDDGGMGMYDDYYMGMYSDYGYDGDFIALIGEFEGYDDQGRAEYTNGTFCGIIAAQRSGHIEFVPTYNKEDDGKVVVEEPSTCYYAMTVYCTVPKTRKPTDKPTNAPTIATMAPSTTPTFAPTSEFDRTFNICTSAFSLDDSERKWCLGSLSGIKDGALVGFRPYEPGKKNQIWKLDEIGQLHFSRAYNLCVSIDFSNANASLVVADCAEARRRKLNTERHLQAITKWSFGNDGLVGLIGGEKLVPALSSDDKYGAAIMVTLNSPGALVDLTQEFGATPITASPTVAPTFDGQTAAPTSFLSQTFEIQSTFKFDDSERSWCLQVKNIRFNANLDMRPCEGRKRQLWQITEDGKIRLKGKPAYCIANVQGKILKLGYCKNGADGTDPNNPTRNISTFAYDRVKGELTATNIRNDTFYFGFDTETKYKPIRLHSEGTSESQSFWKLNGV